MFCIPKPLIDKFVEKFNSKEITPESLLKLADISSDARRAYFSDLFGEQNAKSVNALYESKILLKDQMSGIANWVKQIGGKSPEVMRDMLSRVERLTKVLEPKELDAFLADLAEQKLGFGVTMAEAGKITELAKIVADKKENITPENRLEYGAARVVFHNYVNGLKLAAEKTSFKEALKNPAKLVSDIAGLAKAVKASMDNSAIFRQGWKVLFTHPGIWLRNAKKSFSDIVRTIKGEKVMDGLNADILSRENSLNGYYRKSKLDVGTVEEAYPTTLPEKIPGLGRLYKASEVAFTAFVHRMRADVFDKYVEIAKKSGVDLTSKAELESLGKLVNSLTGRGALGKLEPVAGVVNNVFFSPRLLKSSIDVLTGHSLDRSITPFVRKQAAINLLKVVSGTAAIMTIANALKPKSAETDPRSSDFGKIRIGDTRFDISGGMSSIITLASRLITMSSKSSATGRVNPINSGEFGAQTGTDVVYNFFENKLSPASSIVKDLLKGKDFQGNKPTVAGEAVNLFAPLPITTYAELKSNPNSADSLLALIADGLGISINTYSVSQSVWDASSSKELEAFKKRVGDAKFQQANKDFNNAVNSWFTSVRTNPLYTNLSEEDKQRLLTAKKTKLKDSILKKYGFIYHAPASKKLPRL